MISTKKILVYLSKNNKKYNCIKYLCVYFFIKIKFLKLLFKYDKYDLLSLNFTSLLTKRLFFISILITSVYEYKIQIFMNYRFVENDEGAEAASQNNVYCNLS